MQKTANIAPYRLALFCLALALPAASIHAAGFIKFEGVDGESADIVPTETISFNYAKIEAQPGGQLWLIGKDGKKQRVSRDGRYRSSEGDVFVLKNGLVSEASKEKLFSAPPKNAASGLPTGKRQHKPIAITKPVDKASPAQGMPQNLKGNENPQEAGLLLPAVQKVREAANTSQKPQSAPAKTRGEGPQDLKSNSNTQKGLLLPAVQKVREAAPANK